MIMIIMASKFVRKLDDPNEFNKIKTNVKLQSELSKNESQKYSVWYNELVSDGFVNKNKSNIRWIGRRWKEVYRFIIDRYDRSSLRSHIESLANVLLAIDKEEFKETVRPMFLLGISIQKSINLDNELNLGNEKEVNNFVSFQELENKRDILLTAWSKNPMNRALNYSYLILSLNTYIPPLRLDILKMKIIRYDRVNQQNQEVPDDKSNYLWEYLPDTWSYVINHDKIEHMRAENGLEKQIIKFNDEIDGVTNGKLMNMIVSESLEQFPRSFLLSGLNPDLPLSVMSYDNILHDLFPDRYLHQNLIRKAYVNYWHSYGIDNKNLNERDLKKISSKMRHSLGTARVAYKKSNLIDGRNDRRLSLSEVIY